MEGISTDYFSERYRLIRLLGEGGMGKVYLAEDTMLGEEIALKILLRDLSRDEKHAQRFLREVQLTRRVTSPYVVRTFDAGRSSEDLFFTMEYVPGNSLKERIRAGSTDLLENLRIVGEICLGLSAIHQADIIHRDLKPGNVMLSESGVVKIADFGIARPESSELTGLNEVVGSAAYMAPEVWRKQDIGPLADLYSLGVLTYEVLTDRVPFDGESAANIMFSHLQTRPQPPIEVRPDVPLWASDLVMRLLEKRPEARVQSADEVYRIITEKLSRRSRSNCESGPRVLAPSQSASIPVESPLEQKATQALMRQAHIAKEVEVEKRKFFSPTKGIARQLVKTEAPLSEQLECKPNLGVVRQRSNLRQTRSSRAVSVEAGSDNDRGTVKKRLRWNLWTLVFSAFLSWFLLSEAVPRVASLWQPLRRDLSIGLQTSMVLSQIFSVSLILAVGLFSIITLHRSFKDALGRAPFASLQISFVALIALISNLTRVWLAGGAPSPNFRIEFIVNGLKPTLINLAESCLLLPTGSFFQVAFRFHSASLIRNDSIQWASVLTYYGQFALVALIISRALLARANADKLLLRKKMIRLFFMLLVAAAAESLILAFIPGSKVPVVFVPMGLINLTLPPALLLAGSLNWALVWLFFARTEKQILDDE